MSETSTLFHRARYCDLNCFGVLCDVVVLVHDIAACAYGLIVGTVRILFPKTLQNAYDLVRRFGSTKKQLMFANVDLSRQNEENWARSLPLGMQVCVLPNSCGTQV